MKPVARMPVSKGRSVKRFRQRLNSTKAANIAGPMRGGIRL